MLSEHSKVDYLVKEWNRKHAVGALVRYHCIAGDEIGSATKTRSDAWVLDGHSAVLMIEGVPGCVALDSVRPFSRA